MNINSTLLSVAIVCVFTTACTTKKQLNRDLIYKEKIQTIHLAHLDTNISIERPRINGAIASDLISGVIDTSALSEKQNIISDIPDNSFSIVQKSLRDLDVNKVLKNALEHNALDNKAFSENLIINHNIDNDTKQTYLIPAVTPSIIMSADYSQIKVSLRSSTTQQSVNDQHKQNNVRSIYTSVQKIKNGKSSSDENANKQHWIDNPLILKEKIVNGLYDASKQFVDDFKTP